MDLKWVLDAGLAFAGIDFDGDMVEASQISNEFLVVLGWLRIVRDN